MRVIDWTAVHREYRANQLSVLEIARRYALTEGAIRKRAKRDGWQRDLGSEVRQEIRVRLTRSNAGTNGAVNTGTNAGTNPDGGTNPGTNLQESVAGQQSTNPGFVPSTDAEIIASAADRGMAVVESHQKITSRIREEVDRTLLEMRDADGNGVGSLTARAGVLNALSNAVARMIPHERKALALDEPPPPLAPSNGETPVLDAMLAELAKRRRNMEATEMEDDADDGGRY
jgi:hypothetical protein